MNLICFLIEIEIDLKKINLAFFCTTTLCSRVLQCEKMGVFKRSHRIHTAYYCLVHYSKKTLRLVQHDGEYIMTLYELLQMQLIFSCNRK